MPEEYGALKLKVPKEKGEAPNGPQAFKDFADSIAKPATGATGQLLIVQNTGDVVYKAIKGNATLAEDGTLSIANKAIVAAMIADALKPSAGAAAGTEALRALGTTASTAAAGNDSRLSDERTPKALSATEGKIADGAVTSRKAKLTSGIAYGSGSFATGEAFADIPNLSFEITPAVESILLVVASFRVKATEIKQIRCTLSLDEGADDSHQAAFTGPTSSVVEAQITQTYRFTLSAAKHTIKGRYKQGTIDSANSSLLYFLHAA